MFQLCCIKALITGTVASRYVATTNGAIFALGRGFGAAHIHDWCYSSASQVLVGQAGRRLHAPLHLLPLALLVFDLILRVCIVWPLSHCICFIVQVVLQGCEVG